MEVDSLIAMLYVNYGDAFMIHPLLDYMNSRRHQAAGKPCGSECSNVAVAIHNLKAKCSRYRLSIKASQTPSAYIEYTYMYNHHYIIIL